MPEPGPNDSVDPQAEKTAEIERLRSELARLKEKRAGSKDKDVRAVLDMRISQIEAELPAPMPGASDNSELARLRAKLAETTDPDIIAALSSMIKKLEVEGAAPVDPLQQNLKNIKAEEEAAVTEVLKLEKPTPSQADEAERLVRQSRLEKQRGNASQASDLIKRAAATAPASPAVLEALGDDYAERKMTKQARIAYKQALALDPKNVGVDRKYAELVFRGSGHAASSDALLMSGSDQVARGWVVQCLSAILPGVGQMVVGRTVKGICFFLAYVIFWVWITIMKTDVFNLMKTFKGVHQSVNFTVLIPIGGLLVVVAAAVADLSGGSSRAVTRHSKIDRPRPPVDLPFE